MDPAISQAIATIAGAITVLILAFANYVNQKAKSLDDDEDNSGSA